MLRAEHIIRYVKSAHEIRETKSLEDWLQRKLHSRSSQIAKYLRTRKDRFFNSIVVGVFGGLPNWYAFDAGKVAENLELETDGIIENSIGLLVFSGLEQMFAIDGQHRVEGIREAHQKDASSIETDEYSVVFIAHIDDQEGKIETRRLFSDINKRAIPVSKGDNVVIDEDDLSSIVARRLYANYPAFDGGRRIVVTEKEKLPDGDDTHFTNLLTLYAVTKKLRKLLTKAPKSLDHDEVNVSAMCRIAESFLDFSFKNVPTLKQYLKSPIPTLAEKRKDHRNLLFRPVGLVVYTQIYVRFAQINKLDQLALGLKKMRFDSPGGVFDGLLLINKKVQNRAVNQTAALHLCCYQLGLDLEPPEILKKRLEDVTGNPQFKLPARISAPVI